MINEPFEPVSEPRACGWPYHGVVVCKQVSGSVQYKWVLNGVETDIPADITHVPRDMFVAHKVRHKTVDELDLTPDEIASELENGRVWYDFATIAGSLNVFYGKNLGARSWLAILDDNRAWKVSLAAEHISVGDRYRWIMYFSRTNIGPVAAPLGASPTRTFWVELTCEEGGFLFSAASAQSTVNSTGAEQAKITDIALHGDRLIVDGLTIRVLSSADLTVHGLDLDTVTGELPFTFNPLVASSLITTVNGSYGTYITTAQMGSKRRDISAAAVATMPISESGGPLPAGAVSPSSSIRVDSINSSYPDMWVQYHLYDVPPRTEVETWETRIKAHLPENGRDGFVEYVVQSELTATQTYTGQACAWSGYYSQGGNGPNFANCPPPSTASVSTSYTLKQTIEYGDFRYKGERTWSVVEAAAGVTVTDCIPRPPTGSSFTTGNYSIFGALIIPTVYSSEGFAFHRGRPASPNNFVPSAWAALAPVPFPVQPGDSGATVESSWTHNQYSMRTPVVDEDHLIMVPSYLGPFKPIMARFNITTNYAVESLPAAANMPTGLYYKGKHITPWLPTYSDVWTMDPKTYEIHIFPRAALYNSDGYLFAIAI